MRNLIALFACSLAISTASANDPPPAAAHAAASHGASKPAPAEAAKEPAPASAKPSAKAAAAQALSEADAEAELSAKIAARLALMRANQAARLAAAAKAKKVAVTRREAVAAITQPAPVRPFHSDHWSYEGETGPANWGKINSAWSKCDTGTRQSPIDLRDGMKVDLEQITFDYKPSGFSVVDNGHTVQVTVGGGNFLTVQNRSYELMQFHFHRPSEERVNGKGFEMVVHMVHKDPEGKLAVLAVLLERGKGNNMIQTVWNNLPLEKLDVVNPNVVLDVAEMLPQRRDYFTFMGSLTTPPCNEGVLWLVMKQPMQASPAQMALFSRMYPLNARPIQSSAGRMIKESN
ncbi:carbonic anhydrase [Massilia antarctica]|uniref:carbonic anhydrase n=1 Tax=Massilia antarctica TaxID=2765360 RepID=UPI0006BB841C|nr:carbonic anhydrase family protein [Massilia sp. H27-R4]MCY0910981.1 carbonic anhydrase family protein [Massilia sp. H27-R4]CUI09776.1 Carbonic anhydrase [Janthinobacterium sp. CG23_2]CUU33562.1 Carbonic anhydrase [Janthinobacterium sp. CG23_2]